jgi:hypothetical protein
MILPTVASEPSSPSWYQRPPRRVSITTVFNGAVPIECVDGHHRANPEVKTSKA